MFLVYFDGSKDPYPKQAKACATSYYFISYLSRSININQKIT